MHINLREIELYLTPCAPQHLQHGSADVERSERIQVTLTFLVQSLCVFSSVHRIVYVDGQELVFPSNVHLSPSDADRSRWVCCFLKFTTNSL